MHIKTDNQPVTQITVIEPEPGKQAEALALMTERAFRPQPHRRPTDSGIADVEGPWNFSPMED